MSISVNGCAFFFSFPGGFRGHTCTRPCPFCRLLLGEAAFPASCLYLLANLLYIRHNNLRKVPVFRTLRD